MQTDSLAAALEHEHQQIDAGITAFSADPGNRQPLARAIAALRRHIYLEEEFLFPLLRDADPALAAPVFVMLREHAQIWDSLDALDHAPTAGAATSGNDPDTALKVLKQLTVQLLHHNLKEEKILYPRADDALPAPVADRLRSFLATAQLPDGWTCAFKARGSAHSGRTV